MIRILQIIFGLDPVAGELRIARQRLVFFEQLRRVAALAVILAVAAGIAGHALRALSTAATTTAALTIVDQLVVSLSHWRRPSRSPWSSLQRKCCPRRSGPARAHSSASRPSLAVNRLLGGSAAMSSGVGGGGASFS